MAISAVTSAAASIESGRRPDDHYVTPEWAIRRLLEAYVPPVLQTSADVNASPQARPMRVLDPCAARGELLVTVEGGVARGPGRADARTGTARRETTGWVS